MSDLPEQATRTSLERDQRELTEALTAAVMANAAYRRWHALGEDGLDDAIASLQLVIAESRRMSRAAERLICSGARPGC